MICPKCKDEISYLDFNVTGTCSAQMYAEDVKADKPTNYDLACLTENVEYDDFSCPECQEVIALSEEKATEFLKGFPIESITIPIYFQLDNKNNVIIDYEGIQEEFNNKLKDILLKSKNE